jgi:UDPglucose 6-dehydrogenase
VLVTEWPEFKAIDLDAVARAMRGSLLVDGRNFFDPAAARAAGLTYEAVGRPAVNGSGSRAGAAGSLPGAG